VTKLDERAKTRQLLKERLKRHKNPENFARRLKAWISEPESSVDLSHVLQSLQDNRQNFEQLSVCSEVIVKFTHKARLTNRASDWFQSIEKLLQDYQAFGEIVPADLYVSRYYCLIHLSDFYSETEESLSKAKSIHSEAEKSLYKAIALAKTKLHEIEIYLVLAQYYVNSSEYSKLKNITVKCELLCQEVPDTEIYLANTYFFKGLYYFYKSRFFKARNYLEKSKIKLEDLLSKKQEYQQLTSKLSSCLHYIGRTYFEQYDFINAASFYALAQKIIEEDWQQGNLTPDYRKTAYYHLRLGQILHFCKIEHSTKYHYEKATRIYIDTNHSSGLIHVNLALSKIIGNSSHQSSTLEKEAFKDEKKRIKDSANQASKLGSDRVELMALMQLLYLYIKTLNIGSALKVILMILLSTELYKLGSIFFLLSFVYKFGLKLYYKTKFKFSKSFRQDRILYTCPCLDTECKLINK
jgi:tetratricopeptide (TPR) repeat protein